MKITDSLLNNVVVKIQKYTPDVKLSYRLERLSSLKYAVLDRGYAADLYECEIETYGTQDYCESVMAMLQTQRYGTQTGGKLVLSEFATNKGEAIFGNNVVYTGTIDAIVIDTPIMRNESFKVFSLKFKLRALGVTFEVVDDFLVAMTCIWSGWTGGEPEWDRTVNNTYNNDNFVSTVKNNDSKFIGKFHTTTELSIRLLEWFRTNRGQHIDAVPLTWIGIEHAFGIGKTYYDYDFVVTKLSIEQISPLYVQATIELTDIGGIE